MKTCFEACFRTKIGDSRRRAPASARELSEYFSMWANTAPCGGVIIVGINKDRDFEGCSTLHANQRNEIEKTADIFCPDAAYKVKQVPIHRDSDGQDDFVIAFRVGYHESKVVRTTDGRVFVRSGDSLKELKGESIRHIQAEKGEIRFELEPCNIDYPEGFDIKHLTEFVETIRAAKAWEQSHSKEEIQSFYISADARTVILSLTWLARCFSPTILAILCLDAE